jgi:hypothetical protein
MPVPLPLLVVLLAETLFAEHRGYEYAALPFLDYLDCKTIGVVGCLLCHEACHSRA